MLITSNLPFSEWVQVFQGERMTAALLDQRSANTWNKSSAPAQLNDGEMVVRRRIVHQKESPPAS